MNILLNQQKGKNKIVNSINLESHVIYNPKEYYKILFDQEIEKNDLVINDEYYVRGVANIDDKIYVSYYKGKTEFLGIAYKIQEHQMNLNCIAKRIEEEY
jgi:hypothetical protein